MDIKAYITSGVIESYVLGMADEQDAAELQRLSLIYPEIAVAIEQYEEWLSDLCQANAVPVSGMIKDKLAFTLKDEFRKPSVKRHFINSSPGILFKWLSAACLILLIISATLDAYFYDQYKKTLRQYVTLREQQNSILTDSKIYQAKLATLDRTVRVMSAPGILKISLPGVTGKETNFATLYWDTKTKQVYLDANHLPIPPEGKQYQLWALVDGIPVNAGVLENCEGLCQLKTIQKAQAFAITLEKAGGSPTPTLDQMYVLGNVKS